ncbi:MAG: hypothetical protein M1816_004302 [Peltula sp. TS41687]|nr:MAG: hypothetical protein M1816_004302 [Peltula sp. TS41687]
MFLPRSIPLLLFLAITPFTIADVEFTSPAAGASIPGGTAIKVQWKDSGDAPSTSDLKSYQLFLCAGSNENPTQLVALSTDGLFSAGNTASSIQPIQLGIGASTPANA